MSKFTKYLLIILSSAAFFLTCWAVIFTWIYGSQIKNRILDELNKNLLTKVEIYGEVELSVFKYFPQVSLAINDIEVKESIPGSDSTLLKAARVYFVMNVWDVVLQDWKIKSTIIENGELKMKKDEKGNINYRLSKNDADSSSSDFLIDIEKAHLESIRFNYTDEHSEVYLDLHILQATLTGNFSPQKLFIGSTAEIFSNRIEIKEIEYAGQKEIMLNGQLKINPEKNSYELDIKKFLVQKNLFEIKGLIVASGNSTFFDLGINGKNISLGSFPELLPKEVTAKILDLQGNGTVQLKSEIKGDLNKNRSPLITISADVADADLKYGRLTENMEKLSFNGYFTNGKKQSLETSVLSFKNINGVVKGKPLKGNVEITNLNDPSAKINVDGWIDISLFNSLLPANEESFLSGMVLMQQLVYSGKMKDLTNKHPTLNGGIQFFDTSWKSGKVEWKAKTGKLNFDNSKVSVNELLLQMSGSEVTINGELTNLYPYLLGMAQNTSNFSPELWVQLQLTSEKIDLKNLFSGNEEKTNETSFNFQKALNINGSVVLKSHFIEYGKFKAYDVSGNVFLKPNNLLLKEFSLNTMEGLFDLNSTMEMKENVWTATTSVLGYDIDITQLFYQMDNFDQNVITDKNLKGTLTTNIQLNTAFKGGKIDLNALAVKADIAIKNGELINFKPLEKLAGFINLEELKNVKFSALTNQILIDKKIIYIPEMIVKSNALNLAVSGMHTLDNLVDYQIKVDIFDVLASKFRKRKRADAVYEEVSENNFNFFISMSGKIDNPNIKFQKLSAKEKIKQSNFPELNEKEQIKPAYKTPTGQKEEELEFIEWEEDKDE